jgi:hypothetical protein
MCFLVDNPEITIPRFLIQRELPHRQGLDVAAHRGQRGHQLV